MRPLKLVSWLILLLTAAVVLTPDENLGVAASAQDQRPSEALDDIPSVSATYAHLRPRYWGEVDGTCTHRTRWELGYEGPILPPEYGRRNGEAQSRNSHAPRFNHCMPGETWQGRVCDQPDFGDLGGMVSVDEICLSAQGISITRLWLECPSTHICEPEPEPDIDGRTSADCIYNPEESRQRWHDNFHDIGTIRGGMHDFEITENKNRASSSAGQGVDWCVEVRPRSGRPV